MRVAWLEVPHPGLGYYGALLEPMRSLGHNVTLVRARSTGGFGSSGALADRLRDLRADVAFASFGWFPMESGRLPILHEFLKPSENSTSAKLREGDALCGKLPLVVLINKEYALLRAKLEWVRKHCVQAALSVHHDVALYERESGVSFHRIWFGVDVDLFAAGSRPSGDGANDTLAAGTGTAARHGRVGHNYSQRLRLSSARSGAAWPLSYTYDLGFTGVVRKDQTDNWRYKIWKHAWPVLARQGIRTYSGDRGSVHIGVAHNALNQSTYIQSMRSSKLWLSTTGPSDLVGTRYFEVMATGVTLCICNRMSNELVYTSLGIKEGKHVIMFSSLPEFIDLVTNYTTRPEYEDRRRAMLRHAQELAFRRFSWHHVARRVEAVLRKGVLQGWFWRLVRSQLRQPRGGAVGRVADDAAAGAGAAV